MKSTINPDLIIPPDSDLAHLLLSWTDESDVRTWNVANLTNELIAELEGGVATKADIYKAVAARCKGRKPNTIRRIAECAADFSIKTQNKYKDLLSFDHFKTARRLFKDGLTPSLDYALQWAVEGNDMKLQAGRFHTVGQMLNEFLPKEAFENQLQRHWNKTKDRLYDLFLIHDNDYEREVLLRCWGQIGLIVDRLDKTE